MFARVAPAPIEVRWRREDELGSALALARACGGDASRGVAVRSSDGFATRSRAVEGVRRGVGD